MTFRQLVGAYAKFSRQEDHDAEAAILAFLGWAEAMDEEFGKDVRIVLAAADFSREVTTTALWMRERNIDIRCVRIKPYSLADGTVLIDAQQIIPPPEASEYLTKLADKRDEERKVPRHALRREFWTGVLELAREKGAPHGNRAPTEYSWIGRGSGVSLNYAIRGGDVQVEVYIDRGDKDANLRSLAYLEAKKETIERITGPLLWDKLPDGRRACRISQTRPGGWKSPKAEWPDIQARMIDAALAMDKAFRDLLPGAASA